MNVYDKVGQFGWSGLTDESAAPAGGDVFYVDGNSGNATNASTSGQGDSWDMPFSTVNYAISKCSNDAGNVIVIAADHTETIEDTNDNSVSGTVTDEFCVDKSGITIVGMGRGTRRPTFTLATATDACIDVRVSCTLSNLIFYNTVASNNPMIDVQAGAHGFTLENCLLYEVDNSHQAVVQVCLTTGITDVTIRGCRFYNATGGTQALCSFDLEGATHRLRMYDNVWRGDWNEHVIDADTAAGYDVEIIGNVINQLDYSAGLCISLNAATTGIVDDNVCHAGLSSVNPIEAAGCLVGENKITYIEGEAAQGLSSPQLGIRVHVPAAEIFISAQTDLFTIAGGRVLITHLSMQNSVAACDSTVANVKLTMNPTTGSDTDLCVAIDVATDHINCMYAITGDAGDDLQKSGDATDGAVGAVMASYIVCDVGTLDIICDDDAGAGTTDVQTSVTLFYIPLDPGATVVAS